MSEYATNTSDEGAEMTKQRNACGDIHIERVRNGMGK